MSDEIDLSSPEIQAAIEKAARKIFDEEAQGLKDKNTELLGKLKKAQKDSVIDPADLEAVERERDDLRAKLSDATKTANKATKELEAATKRAAETEAAFNNTLRDSALTEALTKAGVTSPALLKAAKALHASGVEVVDDNGAKAVKAGDKALADFITEWAGSDEGKYFVTAPEANGGGAQGLHGKPNPTGDMGGDKAARIARSAELLKANAE